MRAVDRSALVPYSAPQMYALIEDVAAYPDFLPWCTGAEVHSHDNEHIEASLSLRRARISKTFRTRNRIWPGERMDIELVDGPFKSLAGSWRFRQLGEEGSKVSLSLQFEFENKVTDTLFGPYLEESCESLIDSFVARAAEIYG